jgi:hypothetical protein
MTKEQQQQAMQVAMDKYRTGPAGILIFHPYGAESLSPRQFLTQFGADVVVMLLAAFLLAGAAGLKGYAARLGFVALMGLFPTLRSELPSGRLPGGRPDPGLAYSTRSRITAVASKSPRRFRLRPAFMR